MQRWVGAALVAAAAVLLSSALLTSAHPLPSPPERGAPDHPSVGTRTATPGTAAPASRLTGRATPRRTPGLAAKARRPASEPVPRAPRPTATPGRDLRPVRISIPALRVDRAPVPLRVLDDGSLEAPRRYSDVGWWRDGPLPGAVGNAVFVGHLDSQTGPAVFYGLATLRGGDKVTVSRRDKSTALFRVRNVQRFPVTDFPTERVYRRDGPSGLVIITCGGPYDRAAGRYLDNVVVFADRAH